MGVVIEMIGTFILAAVLTVMVLQMQINAFQTDANAKYTYALQAHSNIVKDVLRGYLKQAGYNLTDIEHIILRIDKDDFIFLTDMDEDGSVDTVRITYADYPSGQDPTPKNDFDKMLVVTTDAGKQVIESYGITDFEFFYLNASGQETTVKDNVRTVGFRYKMLSREPVVYHEGTSYTKEDYAMAIAEERVFLKNVWDW